MTMNSRPRGEETQKALSIGRIHRCITETREAELRTIQHTIQDESDTMDDGNESQGRSRVEAVETVHKHTMSEWSKDE